MGKPRRGRGGSRGGARGGDRKSQRDNKFSEDRFAKDMEAALTRAEEGGMYLLYYREEIHPSHYVA